MKARHGFYEYFDHAADVGILVRAESVENLFLTAAEALMNWIGPAPDDPTEVCVDLALESPDQETLFVHWLQELLFQFQHRLLYPTRSLTLYLTVTNLRATLMAKYWNQSSPEGFREVKAVTYHQLKLRKDGDMWEAKVILDV